MSEIQNDNTSQEYVIPKVLRDIVLRNTSDAMAIIRRGIVIEANQKYARMHGYDGRHEISGIKLKDIVAPEYHGILEERIRERDLGKFTTESRIYNAVRKNGDIFQIEVSSIPWPPDTSIALSLVRDVTERELNIETLKESERLYQTISRAMPSGVILVNTHGEIIYANEQTVKISGYSAEEIYNGAWQRDQVDTSAAELFAQAYTGYGTGAEDEVTFIRKDGTHAWLRVSWQPVYDADGVFQGICSVMTDVTERKKRDKLIKETEERYRLLAENASDCIYQLNTDGQIIYISYGIRRYGYKQEDMIGHSFLEYVPPEDRDSMAARLAQDVQSKQSKRYEMRLIRSSGEPVWSDVSVDVIVKDGVTLVQGIARDIDDRRRAEEIARKNEERFRYVLENARDVTYQISLKTGNYEYMSQSIYTILGFTPEEFIRTGFDKMILRTHPDDLPIALNGVKKVMVDHVDDQSGTLEYRYKHKDGHYVWLSTNRVVVRDHTGNPVAIIGNVRDITEHKKAAEALRESEERYRGLIESRRDLIVRVDTENKFTFVNEAYCRTFGKTVEELSGNSFVPLVYEEDVSATLKAMEDLKHPPYRCYVEQRALTAEGWRWIAWEDDAILDEDGNIVEIQGVGRDITKRKVAEEALRRSEQRNRALLNATPDLLFLLDRNGVFLDYKEARDFPLIMPPSEFLGRCIVDVLPGDLGHRCLNCINQTIESGEMQSFEYELEFDGGIHYFEDRFLVSGKDEVLSIVREITDRKIAEEAMRKAHADLERLYNLQREFLNNVTHEVRTPLTAVQGYVKMILEGAAGPINEEQESLLKKVISSSDHLLEIVGGILEIARLKNGSVALRPRAGNPCIIIDRAVSSIIPQAKQKGLLVNVDCPHKSQLGMYDEEKVAIILTNLLSNAVKFTEKGEINVFVDGDSHGFEIIIADSGMGIKPDELTCVFDEFRQLDYPRKHKPTGFGLGLAIVASMADIIGATITISSAKGVGTAFTLYIPTVEQQID